MCGVAGAFFGRGAALAPMVQQLNHAQMHRGPESAHMERGAWFGIGHTRLAINGLGLVGDQPLASVDGRWLVVYNGEIYNHIELRSQLGVDLSSTSDGAVIPELLSREGPDSLARLRGMFAVLAIDLCARRVLLGVDSFGIKPLHWARTGSLLAVASEPLPLADLTGARSPDAVALATMLHRGAMDSSQSGIRDIHRMVPGTWLLFDQHGVVDQGTLVQHLTSADRGFTWQDAAKEFQDSVNAHLMSDVPVALLLSDGVDSSALAVAAKRSGIEVTGMTVDLGGGTRGESEGAKRVAEELEMDHVIVSGVKDASVATQFISAMQRPTVDGLNTFLVVDAVNRAGFKVALSGVGADELLTGYATARQIRGFDVLRKLPPSLRVLGSRAVNRSATKEALRGRWAGIDASTDEALADSFVSFQRQVWGSRQVETALGARPSRWTRTPLGRTFRSGTLANDVSAGQMELYLASQLLPDADAFSMAHSVELRVPFLDMPFAAAVRDIPNRRLGKDAFAKALNSALVDSALTRSKQGFVLPHEEWMRKGLLRKQVDRLRDSDAPVRQVAAPAFVDEALADWDLSRLVWHKMWALTVLDEWLQRLSK